MAESWQQWQGQVFDGTFPLRQYLGGSDHSAVFLTERQGRESQKAAIKLIPTDPKNQTIQLSRWERAMKLSHPHLIRLFQTGRCQLDGREVLYALMEYAEEDLSQILPYRPLTPTESREVLQSVLNVLGYIHGQGWVHGHLRPANIMAIGDQVKLSSDGLCEAGEPISVAGTPSIYVPPEIASGGALSPASDIWSLGVTLVEALTQHLPVFHGPGQGELVVPQTMPAPFLDIVSHCLCPDPQRRWTADEIEARLQKSSASTRKTAIVPSPKAFASWRYVVPALAAGLLLLVMFVGPRLLNRRPNVQQGTSRKVEQPEAKQEPEPSPAALGMGQSPSGTVSAPASLGPQEPTGIVRGVVAQQPLPDVSRKARNTIQGKVRVRVRVTVDSSGNVVAAKFESPGPSKYFANLALQAARRWKFVPPQVGGQEVASEWMLKFEFGRTATKVQSTQAVP